MKILAIETSCDETALCLIEAERAEIRVLGNALYSQTALHARYGGVYPNLAKREHAKNLVPLLKKVLEEAGAPVQKNSSSPLTDDYGLQTILEREPELYEQMMQELPLIQSLDVDAIAVTVGPGLEPALWVGINFARALSAILEKPVIGVNHMEGHIVSAWLKETQNSNVKTQNRSAKRKTFSTRYTLHAIRYPLLALLISGGHTDIVLMDEKYGYEYVGGTRDDAVGEAFDKAARMLGLPYPGGPEISKLAERAREENVHVPEDLCLPRPMLHSDDCDMSFSGIKTAVLYRLKKLGEVSEKTKKMIALEFENAAAEVLLAKTLRALEKTGAKTLILGGGVSANAHIRRVFREKIGAEYPDTQLLISKPELATDNALMIAAAAHIRLLQNPKAASLDTSAIRATGNLPLQPESRT